jgi:large subunit ribosomal protein L4
MELNMTTATGKASSKKLQVSDNFFACEFNESLVHQVVTAYLAGGRSGTHAQKTRAAVRGGGAKPWRQKGTGRARAGTIRSPLWRGGGRAFAAVNRDYSQKVNRKMYRKAIRAIFSELLRQDRLVVVDSFDVDQIGTRALVEKLKSLGIQDALIVSADPSQALYLSARNLHHVDVASVAEIEPVSLVRHEKVLITSDAVSQIEERLS